MKVPAYQAVPYEDYPVTETHVDNLYVAARRAGLGAAPPGTARVLELGCAHAVNLMPMAFHLPRARFVGVDLSPTQIERATLRAMELGLPNLRLQAADVLELRLGDERFDYVIAHGLFSWVPEPVRERILTLCREHLEPGGVAYLSYNAMPAWGIRNAVRMALLEGVDLQAELPQQLRQARALLDQLGHAQPLRGTAEGALITAELQALHDKPDAYLVHEYLVKDSRAFYLREVVERAQRAGLRWVVTTPLHEHAPLDAFHAALIEHLDGRPRAAIVDALVEDIRAGRLRLATDSTPGPEQLRAALPSLVDAGIDRLHAAGLLAPSA